MMVPRSCNGTKMIAVIACIETSSPVERTFRKISQRRMNKIDCFRMESVVPWKNVRRRTRFTFIISRLKIFRFCSRNLRISGKVRPRLFTSSTFRRDSVITPAISFVWLLISVCVVLIFFESSQVSDPRTRIPMTKTGTSSQFLVREYAMRKPMPTNAEKRTLMNAEKKVWVSALTFCRYR